MTTRYGERSLTARMEAVCDKWDSYTKQGQLASFTEFGVSLNSLTERLNTLRLPGLMRLCEALETMVLSKLSEATVHPLGSDELQDFVWRLETLRTMIEAEEQRHPAIEQRKNSARATGSNSATLKPRARTVLIIAAAEKTTTADRLCHQLVYFGFSTTRQDWNTAHGQESSLLAILFIPPDDNVSAATLAHIHTVRTENPGTQLIYLGEQRDIEPMVALLRNGIDTIIPCQEQFPLVMDYLLTLTQSKDQDKSRVLIVEDSRVAVAAIGHALSEHGIDTRAIHDPGMLLQALESFHPDLILMDMYMPRFNGVEATRVLRQIPAYSATPIVYLSGESEISMQIEALRLGGDQFLIKPVNPVLLAAIIKTKIERSHEALRSSRTDGLTGLLNHTAIKSCLQNRMEQMQPHQTLTIAMIDIDHFKSINDTYGHPVGDQVIRSLAWLLKGHLRSNDLIGRYGGEEFLIALPDVALAQACAVIDRIRTDFLALPHAHTQGELFASFSAGVAAYGGESTATQLTTAADNALLLAKKNGRNRIETAP